MALQQLIAAGYGDEQNYNCAERILAGAQEAYSLGLDEQFLTFVAGMGAGMGIGHTCGAVNAAVMVLGYLYSENGGRNSVHMRSLVRRFLQEFETEMSALLCRDIKRLHNDPILKCGPVIEKAAQLLDRIVAEEQAAVLAHE